MFYWQSPVCISSALITQCLQEHFQSMIGRKIRIFSLGLKEIFLFKKCSFFRRKLLSFALQ